METDLPTLGYPLGFLVVMAFALGASVGSFLNVVIARVPFGLSIIWPPSHCGTCGAEIAGRHNVPILSWFILRGRCANCLAPFSVRYALIELFFALVCALAVARHGLSLAAAREIVLVGFLLPLAAIDLQWWILPSGLTWGGAAAGLALAAVEGSESFLWKLLAAAVGYTSLVLVGFVGERLMKKEAMGAGDPPLMALIGAFVGLGGLFPVLLLASIQGALIGGALILARRRSQPEPEGAGGTEGGEPSPAATTDDREDGREATADAGPVPSPAGEPAAGAPPDAGVPSEEEWVPDPTAIPFGPYLAIAAAEVVYFPFAAEALFPIAALFQ